MNTEYINWKWNTKIIHWRVFVSDMNMSWCGVCCSWVNTPYYYPFGSVIQNRSWASQSYRFGFNNQERDAELNENYAFKYRIHDARLGRFLSLDPLHSKYPFYSPYSFCSNSTIMAIELEGLESAAAATTNKVEQFSIEGRVIGVTGFSDNAQVKCLVLEVLKDKNVLEDLKALPADMKYLLIIDQLDNKPASSVYSNDQKVGQISLPPDKIQDNQTTLGSLVYEFENLKNQPLYQEIRDKAEKLDPNTKKPSISKDDFVGGFFKLEAKAMTAQLEYEKEHGIEAKGSYAQYYSQYKANKEVEITVVNGDKAEIKKVKINNDEEWNTFLAERMKANSPAIVKAYEKEYDERSKKAK